MDVTWVQVGLLSLVSLMAGTIDAIAGGGGLLTLPALLAAGLPPHLALGTNKGQSVFGTFAATVRFSRSGLVDWKRGRLTFPLALGGSLLGATLVLWLRPEVLRPLVLGLLIAVAAFLTFRRPVSVSPGTSVPIDRRRAQAIAALAALVLGAYDGFFGPGTGTFLIVVFVAFLGENLQRASASAKVANLASNLAAVGLFALRGVVIWRVAVPMAAAQLLGGYFGAHLAVRGGDTLIRRVALAVVAALVLKLSWDLVVH